MEKSNILIFMLVAGVIFNSCKKDNVSTREAGQISWIKTLDETVFISTENERYLGQNGKVLTDQQDNIFLYYYKEPAKETVLIKCNAEGVVQWKKTISAFSPSDMVLLPNGSLVLSGNDPDHVYQWNKFYRFQGDNQMDSLYATPGNYNSSSFSYTINSTMYALPDNSIIASGVTQLLYTNTNPLSYVGSCYKINSSFQLEWKRALINYSYSSEKLSQNSIIPTNNNQYLFEFALTTDKDYVDNSYHGLLTGLLNADGTIDTIYFNRTGYTVTSTGDKSGIKNHYCNGLMPDGTGNFMHHYSAPTILGNSYPSVPAGFTRIGNDAIIKEQIPIPLPVDYQIVSCVQNNGRFLMTAYKSGIVDGTSDYSAEHTLFLTGSDWHTTNTFSFQNFYSDFFLSAAPTADGGFIIMGKIQSFNGPENKLILIKWNN